jgi:hypothetical protein
LLLLAALGIVFAFVARGNASEVQELPALPMRDSFLETENPLNPSRWAPLQWSAGSVKTGAVRSTGNGWGPWDAFSTINGAYWTPEQFGTKKRGQAVSAAIRADPGLTSRYLALWLNMPEPSVAKSGYRAALTFKAGTESTPGTYEAVLSKWVGGTQTILASKEITAEKFYFALSYNEGNVKLWTAPEGVAFKEVLSQKDSTFAQGFAGIEGSGNNARLSSFAAGDFHPYKAGFCGVGSTRRFFGGECWELVSKANPATLLNAAADCAQAGGHLPGALELMSWAKEVPYPIGSGGELTRNESYEGGIFIIDTTVISAEKQGSVGPEASMHYRCVFPAPPQEE